MADNIPNIPAGAVPPKKETGKVRRLSCQRCRLADRLAQFLQPLPRELRRLLTRPDRPAPLPHLRPLPLRARLLPRRDQLHLLRQERALWT
jgi:hypothetical protein